MQFHPEVHHTQQGTDILRNFVFDICGADANWTPQRFIDETVAAIRKTGRRQAASFARFRAAWIPLSPRCWCDRAIGDQLTCIFVNNGVLRKNEFDKVQKNLRDKLGLNI